MFQVPNYNFTLPWFMFDLFNRQLITSRTVPGDIVDSKNVILTETPIPGLNYQPIQQGGNANRKLSFTLPLLEKNNTIGNSLLLAQFATLRNQSGNLLNNFKGQFTPNPKVLYFWGTMSVPLVYRVAKVNFTHKKNWVNQQGRPQYSEVQIELILDEKDPAYKAEEMFREVSALTGATIYSFDNTVSPVVGGR
jgi:hypothetical protein